MEEIGYDREERLYFVMDDNRLYRRTDPPPMATLPKKPKVSSKAGRAAAQAAKKRKLNEEEKESEKGEPNADGDAFGGRKWECLAVSLVDCQNFLESLRTTKDPNERALHKYIQRNVLPIAEGQEEERQKKIRQREKELLNQEKLARAKRSSRIASKQEKERETVEAAEAERKRRRELVEAHRLMDQQKKIEQDRQSRMQTREQRLKEREAKRVLEEEELKRLTEAQEKGEGRMSARNVHVAIGKKRKVLEELEQEEDWVFDCSGCGVYGKNVVRNQFDISTRHNCAKFSLGRRLPQCLMRALQRMAA